MARKVANSAGRFGPRYGNMLRKKVNDVESTSRAKHKCPYCGKAGESIDQVLKEYEGKVKMVYRDFPLSFHDRAVPAAVAANCSGEQGKYWEMHNLLMSNQRALTEADLTSHATSLSLDLDK